MSKFEGLLEQSVKMQCHMRVVVNENVVEDIGTKFRGNVLRERMAPLATLLYLKSSGATIK